MKTTKKVLTGVLMLAVMCVMLFSTSAFAKTTSVKKQKFTTKVSTVEKKVAKVKKGTVTLKMKGGMGFVKFKAPKTAKYSFTLSNLKAGDYNNGFITGYKITSWGSLSTSGVKFSTKGGKTDTLWIGTQASWDLRSDKTVNTGSIIPKRTGKIKLNKGETLYMYLYFGGETATVKMAVK